MSKMNVLFIQLQHLEIEFNTYKHMKIVKLKMIVYGTTCNDLYNAICNAKENKREKFTGYYKKNKLEDWSCSWSIGSRAKECLQNTVEPYTIKPCLLQALM